MAKSELIAKLTEHYPQLIAKDVEVAVTTILEGMFTSLVNGRFIEIRGFRSFDNNQRPARTGRNPKPGESVPVSEKCVPHFKPGRAMRERVTAQQQSCYRVGQIMNSQHCQWFQLPMVPT